MLDGIQTDYQFVEETSIPDWRHFWKKVKNIRQYGLSGRTASDLSTFDNNTQEISSATLRQSIEETERAAIGKALTEQRGKINQAADSLGISRKKLWEKMKRYGIEK